jgi:alpha-galactosidase
MTDAMVSTGLAAKGYEYMLIQECIVPAGARDPITGVLQPDPKKFPFGLANLTAYFHSNGLKAGIYTDVMNQTCAGYEGSGPGPGHPSHWPLDAMTFAQWGFDMIEADVCGSPGDGESGRQLYAHASAAIAAAQAQTNRTITFYMCDWADSGVSKWAPAIANLFRNTGDIQSVAGQCSFERILKNFDGTVINSGTPPSKPGLPGTGIGAWNGKARFSVKQQIAQHGPVHLL